MYGDARWSSGGPELGGLAPGRQTLVQLAARARAPVAGDAADVGAAPAAGQIAQLKAMEGAAPENRLQRLFGRPAAASEAAAQPEARPSGGSALPGEVRSKMEGSLGADFSDVRVHEGGAASSFGALAFAQGNDLHFAPGQYDPGSMHGQQLIGHELTHVVQQRQGRVAAPAQGKGAAVNEDPALEAEADTKGTKAALGLPADGADGAGLADEDFEYDEDDAHPEDDTDPEVEGESSGGSGGASHGTGGEAEAEAEAHGGSGGGTAHASSGPATASPGLGVMQPMRGRAVMPIQFAKHKYGDKTKKHYYIYEVVLRSTQQVVYRGQTLKSVGIQKRFKQHCKQKNWKANKYKIRKIDKGLWTAFEACCYEQWYIERQGMQFLTFNKINAITRAKFDLYRKLHKDLPHKWKPQS